MPPDTIEIFVHELQEAEAVGWLRQVFDDLEKVKESPIVTYHGDVNGTTIPVQITEHVQNGPYTSIWFSANDTPWDSTTACASDAHQALGREVLCYPDQVDDPWRMSRFIQGEEERVDEREITF